MKFVKELKNLLSIFWPFVWVGFDKPARRVWPSALYQKARFNVSNISASHMSDAADATMDALAEEAGLNPRGVLQELKRRRQGQPED